MIYVRFTPESGHFEGSRKESAYDPKRTSCRMKCTEKHPAEETLPNALLHSFPPRDKAY